MDGFNYQMNESGEADPVDHLRFINGGDFSSGDVDQELFDSRGSLLNSIEQIDDCQDTSFLNPINDILNMNDFNKNCDQSIQQCGSASDGSQLANPWDLQIVGSDIPKIENTNISNEFFAISTESGQSVSASDATTGFPTTDCSFGSDYSSAINQLFQNLEQQQMPFMAPSLPALPLSNNLPQDILTVQGYSDTFSNTISALPASTTITPIAVEEHQLIHRPKTPVQQEVTIEAYVLPERGDNYPTVPAALTGDQRYDSSLHPTMQRVFPPGQGLYKYNANYILHTEPPSVKQNSTLMTPCTNIDHGTYSQLAMNPQLFVRKPAAEMLNRRATAVGFQKNRLHWTAVFPPKKFIQPPEMIIMHPLRTRKVITTRRSASSSNNNTSTSSNSTINLSEYFDTSTIDIPLIKERAHPVGRREHRRKQKLNIIPGSEDLIFEVKKTELSDADDFVHNSCFGKDATHVEIDPYPETELPELDEIFRRKKKSTAVIPSGTKRTCSVSQAIRIAPAQKRLCQNNNAVRPPAVVQESSASFDEKVSVSITLRKSRSNLSIDKNELTFSSESDFIESDNENDSTTSKGKSLKCQKCKKIFKTTRSLSIHTKRCAALRLENSADIRSGKNHDSAHLNSGPGPKYCNLVLKNTTKTVKVVQDESFKFDFSNLVDNYDAKNPGACGESKPRPITRSQTRQTIRRSDAGIAAAKESK